MIVKDGAATLGRCLESVSPFVDRIVIGDTGSADDSIDIGRHFGAEVYEIPWEQDFARARNRVLERAKCDWVLVLDSDEMLDTQAPSLMEQAIARTDVHAYDIWRWNYLREVHSRSGEQAPLPNPVVVEASRSFPTYALSLNTRLFRRHAEIYFEYCVHETVANRVDALGLTRMPAEFVIHHFGQAEDPEAIRRGKNELYQELGRKKIQSDPKDARGYFELGLGELEHYRRPAAALAYFERAASLMPRYAAAWLFAGICLVRVGRHAEALRRMAMAHGLGLRTPVLYEAIGDAHFHAGEYGKAREAYEQALAVGGISSLNRAKLGACETHVGLKEQGTRSIQDAIEASPEFGELYDILVAAALLAGDLPLAAQTAEARLAVGAPEGFHYQLAVELQVNLGKQPEAQAIAQRGLALFPDHPGLQQAHGADGR
jgi:tetratricopeptide (TPR) repeat protein